MAAPGPITVGPDGFARFDVALESGASAVWVEIESPGLTAADAVVRSGGTDEPLTTTALGAIAIVPASGSTQSFAVALLVAADPDIAVTVVDGSGNVLSSASYRLTLVDYRTLPQTAAPNPPGFLALTGLTIGAELILGLVGLGVGGLLVARARKREAAQL